MRKTLSDFISLDHVLFMRSNFIFFKLFCGLQIILFSGHLIRCAQSPGSGINLDWPKAYTHDTSPLKCKTDWHFALQAKKANTKQNCTTKQLFALANSTMNSLSLNQIPNQIIDVKWEANSSRFTLKLSYNLPNKCQSLG